MDSTSLLKQQRGFFATGASRAVAFRLDALRRLASAIEANEGRILLALANDLRKPPHEAYAAEVAFVLSEISYAARCLARWARPQRRRPPRMAWPARAQIAPEPRGVALILGAWNYPVQLLMSPLVGAVSAGCCTVLKTSEMAPASSEVIADIVCSAFPPEYVAVVHGDREVARELLSHRFDQIFFTGSAVAGREVMSAAARHLTPVVLELGGKSPCIVLGDAPMAVAARRIIWGKMMNAGQTCAAPDYVLVDARRHDELVAELKLAIEQFYGADPRESPDFGRIIGRAHFDRLQRCLGDGRAVVGGVADSDGLYVAPTVLTGVGPESAVMSEEVFGPILPVLPVASLDEALRFVADRPTPLCAYVFTNDRCEQQRVSRDLRCGSLCINDVVLQLFGKDLPFGGLGESGMGAYHGKASFDAFSHYKPILQCRTWMDLRFRYPPARLPIGRFKKVIRFLLRK